MTPGIYSVGMSTGARPHCEVACMRWDDIRGGAIVFRSSKERVRTIPLDLLAPSARARLEAQRGKHRVWVWPAARRDGYISESCFRRHWAPFRELARSRGMMVTTVEGKPLSFYQASRHAAATYWLGELGIAVEVVRELLGHDSPRVLRRYAQLNVEHLREDARRIAASYQVNEVDMQQIQQAGLRPARVEAAISAIREAKPELLKQLTVRKRGEDVPASDKTLRNWAKGEREPSFANLHRLALMSGVSVGHFFGEGDEVPEVKAGAN